VRILQVITVPFFEPRGTAFSALHRTRVLGEMGHEVDILTYPLGEDVPIARTRIYRTVGLPFLKGLKMGPSLPKLLLDILLAAKTLQALLGQKYDCLHVHEEAAYWAAPLKTIFRIPIVYDMHSSMPQQLSNFGFSDSRALIKAVELYERWVLRRSDVVIVICQALKETVERAAPGKQAIVIENLPVGANGDPPDAAAVEKLRRELGLQDEKAILYTGTFGLNQGLEPLIHAISIVAARTPNVRCVLVGGEEADIQRVTALVDELELGEYVTFTGRRPVEEMPAFMALADILVSPRLAGTNTPLKIYSYLKAGRPIVATRLFTHTQVLDDQTALLVEPSAEALAEGILKLLAAPELCRRLADNARRLAEAVYNYENFAAKTGQAFAQVEQIIRQGERSRRRELC
jgi:glycosyltransferase involved in cell wall biosynthesis